MSKELKIKGALGNDFQQIYIDDEPTNFFISKEGRIKTATIKDSIDGGQVEMLGDNLTVPGNVRAKYGDHLNLSSEGHVNITAGANTRQVSFYNMDTLQAYISSRGTYLETGLYKKEVPGAAADLAGYGQLWVKNESPNELWFTTDAGDDIQITDGTSTAGGGGGTSYHYTMHNWYAGSGSIDYYIPWGGSTVEHSSTSDSMIDDQVWIAPFAGKIVEARVYSDLDTGSTDLNLSVNGTLGSSLLSGGAVNCSSDKTVYTFTCDQNNTFSAGDVIRVFFDGTNHGNQMTFSIKWEIS